MKKLIVLAALVVLASTAFADSASDLAARFNGRQGSASEDRRHDDHTLGIKTGCSGDTFTATVTLSGVSATLNGNVATVHAHYDGGYTRQGWIDPCVQSGHEDRHVYGDVTFTLTQQFFGSTTVAYTSYANIGEVAAQGHDSNEFARRAVEAAVRSGM